MFRLRNIASVSQKHVPCNSLSTTHFSEHEKGNSIVAVVALFSIQGQSFYTEPFLKTREKKATRPFTKCKLLLYSGLEKVSDYQHLAYNDVLFKSSRGRAYSDKLNMPYAPKRKNFVSYNIVRTDKGIKRTEIKVEISPFTTNEVGAAHFDKMLKRPQPTSTLSQFAVLRRGINSY